MSAPPEMSSRALRKAQKQKEEEAILNRLKQEAEELESSGEDEVDVKPQRSAFALLNDQDDDDAQEDHDQSSADEQPQEDSQPESKPVPKTSSNKRQKNKKKKSKQPPTYKDDESLDDIDAALKSLKATSKLDDANVSQPIDPEVIEACKLLSIDNQNLHAENEMRRLFGRAAMESDDQDQQQDAAGRRRNRQQMGGLAAALGRRQGATGGRSSGLGLLGLRRNLFIQGKEEWPVGTSGGLGMEVVAKRADGTVEYRFVHNTTYQDVQADFDVCVRGMDPERMIRLLQLNPYHISTLLQVSEIAKQERDHTTSGDLLERALFSFGRTLHSTFAGNLAQGKARMNFKRPENREFWLAASRYMTNLSMRATWRTVFEWAKLLLSLDPEEDPYQMCLVIDQYALRARQAQQLLDLAANSVIGHSWRSLHNMQLSLALAATQAGRAQVGKQALFTAANRSPWVLTLLFQELGLDAPPGIWGATPRTDWEKLMCTLYATRAKDLWASPEVQQSLLEVASAVTGAVNPDPPSGRDITLDEARHVLLADLPSLIALLPRHFTSMLTSSSDPLPPMEQVRSYTLRTPEIIRIPRSGPPSSLAAARAELMALHNSVARLIPDVLAHGEDGEGDLVADRDIEAAVQGSGMTRDDFLRHVARLDELLRYVRGQLPPQDQEEEDEDEDAHGHE